MKTLDIGSIPIDDILTEDEKRQIPAHERIDFVYRHLVGALPTAYENPEYGDKAAPGTRPGEPARMPRDKQRKLDRLLNAVEHAQESDGNVVQLTDKQYAYLQELWRHVYMPPLTGSIRRIYLALESLICPDDLKDDDAD